MVQKHPQAEHLSSCLLRRVRLAPFIAAPRFQSLTSGSGMNLYYWLSTGRQIMGGVATLVQAGGVLSGAGEDQL